MLNRIHGELTEDNGYLTIDVGRSQSPIFETFNCPVCRVVDVVFRRKARERENYLRIIPRVNAPVVDPDTGGAQYGEEADILEVLSHSVVLRNQEPAFAPGRSRQQAVNAAPKYSGWSDEVAPPQVDIQRVCGDTV